ncbi:hypothetical protein [Streptomyces sp. RKAG337]|uniref:hypothetical protein n=1 Tax=Streptomyces sp. RKAG337 TaxID=2893404 RepID=UPI00203495F7|nr:hypothetical protein [Streptomyces sp. RKAG337]MCM2430950.1 hypothetical protein [Streptomyces sp. RKAG337]
MPTDVVVFIASKNTTSTHRRVLWRVSEGDARKLCSDDRTSGRNHMLCWTAHEIDDPEINRYVRDTGSYAQVLAEHQVVVLGSLAAAGQKQSQRRTHPRHVA